MTEPIIEAQGLTKRFTVKKKTVEAVTDLTFQGPVVRLSMRAADGHPVIAHLGPEDHLPGLRPGDRLWAHWPDDAACVLPDAPLPAVDDPDAVDE